MRFLRLRVVAVVYGTNMLFECLGSSTYWLVSLVSGTLGEI